MIAARFGIRPWEMSRLTGRELDLLAAEFGGSDDDDFDDDIDPDRVLADPPVPRGIPGV